MTILDRMLFIAFIRAFFICLISILSLYIIIDLFMNLDSFTTQKNKITGSSEPIPVNLFIQNIFFYYTYRTAEYFDRLAEAIILIASVFTISWMQRSNEILPLLSAGVSLKRILRPILIGAFSLLSLASINQELIIPKIADILMKDRDDLQGERQILIQSGYDLNGVMIEGMFGYRNEQRVELLFVTTPDTTNSRMIHLSAANARYIAPNKEHESGGWLLTDTYPRELDPTNVPDMVEMLDPGRFFVKTRSLDFEALTRHPKWYMYSSTQRLHELLEQSDAPRQSLLAVIFHMRFTRPMVGMILVVLGLSIILRDQTRNIFIGSALCLGICVSFYGLVLGCRFLGSGEYLSPALAAWLPVITFGPLTIILYDEIHT